MPSWNFASLSLLIYNLRESLLTCFQRHSLDLREKSQKRLTSILKTFLRDGLICLGNEIDEKENNIIYMLQIFFKQYRN